MSPDGKRIAVADYEGQDQERVAILRIFDIPNFEEQLHLDLANYQFIKRIQFVSSNSIALVVNPRGDNPSEVSITVDIETGEIKTSDISTGIKSEWTSPLGTYRVISTSYGSYQIYDSSNNLFVSIDTEIIHFSIDEKFIIYVINDDTISVMSTESKSVVNSIMSTTNDDRVTNIINSLSLSQDGRYIAATIGNVHSWSGEIIVWRIDDWQELIHFSTDLVPIELVFSPQDNYFATLNTSYSPTRNDAWPYDVNLWELSSGTRILNTGRDALRSNAIDFVFNSSGDYLAVAYNDRSIRVWDVNSKQVITTYEHGTFSDSPLVEGTYLTTTPDKRYIISTMDDGVIRLWNWPVLQ